MQQVEITPETAEKNHVPEGGLVSKNVRIRNRRTSVRLEPPMWEALADVARAEHVSVHDLCTAVDELKPEGSSFTGALRVFLMDYYRSLARSIPRVTQVQQRLSLVPARLNGRKSR